MIVNVTQFLLFLLILCLLASPAYPDSNSCTAVDKTDTFGPKLVFHCHNRLIVNLIKAAKTNHVLVEIWPLYDSDNPVSFEWLPRLNESDVKLLKDVTSYTISVYSTDLNESATYTEMVQRMGVPVQDVIEVFLQGCINFRVKQLDGLRNVWSLYISGSILNKTEENPDLGQMFPELRLLSLKLNQLRSPPKIDSIPFLEEFLLDMNEVQQIPDGYFKSNRHLSTIYINELTLSTAPKDLFQGMDYLESLTYRTSLAEFPNLQGCHELQALEIQSPDAKKLPSEMFKDQKNLRSFKLFGCDIEEIDKDAFKYLKQLREIDLSYNRIRSLPPTIFSNNTELWNIDLSYNNMTKFSDEVLPNSTKSVNLRYTQIRSFNVTKNLTKLVEIDVSNSELSGSFDIKNFTKFYPNIRSIVLGGNQLTNVTVLNNFRSQRDSLTLDLHDNRIVTVSVQEEATTKTNSSSNSTTKNEESSKGVTKLKINLSGNPLRCDCYLRRFVQVLIQKGDGHGQFHVNRDVKCTWPKNRTLFTVDLGEMNC